MENRLLPQGCSPAPHVARNCTVLSQAFLKQIKHLLFRFFFPFFLFFFLQKHAQGIVGETPHRLTVLRSAPVHACTHTHTHTHSCTHTPSFLDPGLDSKSLEDGREAPSPSAEPAPWDGSSSWQGRPQITGSLGCAVLLWEMKVWHHWVRKQSSQGTCGLHGAELGGLSPRDGAPRLQSLQGLPA